VSALLRSLRRAWAWISRLVHRVAQLGTQAARLAGTRTTTFTRNAKDRLAERWQCDGSYRRTLIAALSAIAATLLPHPAAAAALGALVAERPVRPSHRREPFSEDDYPPRRTPLDPWAPSPRRLWDTHE
jgi:hypothetical protein